MPETSYDSYQMGQLLAMSTGSMIFSLLFSVFIIICVWRMFKKAGKEGWEAIIPIYNTVVLFKIAKINPLVLLWLLLPFIGWIIFLVFEIKACINLAKGFGKSGGFAVGLIFLSPIFLAILAFDSSNYDENLIVAK